MSSSKKVVHRDSGSGQFTTKRYAETHKPTTEREVIHRPTPTPAPVKKK